MKNVRFEINGVAVDFVDASSFPVKIYKQIADANDLGAKLGDYTLTIRLPRTKVNEEIFRGFYELATLDKFRRAEAMKAAIFVNGAKVILGQFVLMKTTPENFEGVVYAENTSVFRKLGEKLTDIQSFAPVAFTGEAFMRDQWTKGWRDCPLQFPLIAYGGWFNPNLAGPDREANGIFYDPKPSAGISASATGINWEDVQPAVYVAAILKAMFADIGYQVGGFFSEEGSSLIMPYTRKDRPAWNWGSVGQVVAQRSFAPLNFDDISLTLGDENYFDHYEAENDQPATVPFLGVWAVSLPTVVLDPALLFNAADGEFIAPADGNYTFRIKIDFQMFRRWDNAFETTPGTIYNPKNILFAALRIPPEDFERESLYANLKAYLIDVPGATLFDPNICTAYELNALASTRGPWTIDEAGNNAGGTVNADTVTTWISYPNAFETDINGFGFVDITGSPKALKRGDRVRLVIIQPTTIDNGNAKKLLTVQASCTDASVEITNDLDTSIQVAKLLPEISQRDFLEDLVSRFNLFWQLDPEGQKIYFLKEADYFHGNEFASDWNGKAAASAGDQLAIEQFKALAFTWVKDGRDYYYREAQQAEDNYTRQNDSIFAAGTKEVGAKVLAASQDRLFFNYSEGPTVAAAKPMFMPIIADEERAKQARAAANWVFDYVPRLLSYGGLRDCPLWEFHNGAVLLSSYPFAFFNAERITSGAAASGISLGFGGLSGLFRKYWANMVEEAERSHLLEVFALLDETDVATIDPARPVFLEGIYYKINKVDGYNPTAEAPTRIELIRRLRNNG